MSMLAEGFDAVIGADTHRDTHSLVMITPAGVSIATLTTVPNTDDGFAQVMAWIAAHAPGAGMVLAGLEGTRSYGIGLARALTAAGHLVVEVERPRRTQRRGRGKSDVIDAELAARQVITTEDGRAAAPRADGPREALRILLAARRDLTVHRTAHINALRALLLTGGDTDRDLARGRHLTSPDTLARLRRRRTRPGAGHLDRVRTAEIHRLATAIHQANTDITANTKDLTVIVDELNPHLTGLTGVGPVSAAQALVSFSHPGRCRNDAAFAALAGVSPLLASSGRTDRHRLNRGGDRQLNKALHTIVLTRWRTSEKTKAYITKRRAQGIPDRHIRRVLKRYIARELFNVLTHPDRPPTQPTPAAATP